MMRGLFSLLLATACVTPRAVTADAHEPTYATTANAIDAPVALVMAGARAIQEARNGSRIWFGMDVEVDTQHVRWRRCDEAGACVTEIEVAPLEDFLGVAAVPDSMIQQLRFRENSPTDKRLAFRASRQQR